LLQLFYWTTSPPPAVLLDYIPSSSCFIGLHPLLQLFYWTTSSPPAVLLDTSSPPAVFLDTSSPPFVQTSQSAACCVKPDKPGIDLFSICYLRLSDLLQMCRREKNTLKNY
uniref:Uncharacterized protein n=1 Tax=Gasterosteus aculeatus TaxID=69293 RepID=G3PZN3_GASAC